MRKTILLFLSFLLLLALVACEPMGPKVAVVGDADFDFGEAEQGSKVNHTFTLRNDGDQDLLIRKVRSSCGCTVAKPSKETVEPGDTTEIEATFSIGRRRGRQQKKITVMVNDPNNQQIILMLRGNVKIIAQFEPERLSFAHIDLNKPVTKTVTMTNKGDKPMTFTGFKVSSDPQDQLSVKLAKSDQTELPLVINPGEQLTITATLTLTDERPRFYSRLTLQTEERPDSPFTYSISGRKKGPIKKMKLQTKKPMPPGALKLKKKK